MEKNLTILLILGVAFSCAGQHEYMSKRKSRHSIDSQSWKINNRNYREIISNNRHTRTGKEKELNDFFQQSKTRAEQLDSQEKKLETKIKKSYKYLTKSSLDKIKDDIVRIQEKRIQQYLMDLHELDKILMGSSNKKAIYRQNSKI